MMHRTMLVHKLAQLLMTKQNVDHKYVGIVSQVFKIANGYTNVTEII